VLVLPATDEDAPTDELSRRFEQMLGNDRRVILMQSRVDSLIMEADGRLLEFRRRCEALPLSPVWVGQRPITALLLMKYEAGLNELKRLNDALADSPDRPQVVRLMMDQAGRLVTVARQIPDTVEGMTGSLADARRAYRSSLVAVWLASAIIVVLFLGLLRSGYVWIFAPIRKLHQGARRVALGDFNYRVCLETRDEMAELADAFNQMTSRFQETAADLDLQVQERSRQLVRSERLAGVGFLAAGVAHEINNPLSAIAMAGESLEGRVLAHLDAFDASESDVIRQYLRMIQDESFRCREITERLLDFSRGREAVRETTDVSRLVSEVVAMVQYLSKYRDKKIVFASSEPCYADVNGPEIKQVILNLVANGLESVEPGGLLQIALHEQTDHLVLEFTDNGCGMTADVLERLFEPFFTKKQTGQGTGLGLSISHRIINQHGGTISASSPGPGRGSTFAVRLPRRQASLRAAA
jgi:signal transduction histidine kinase